MSELIAVGDVVVIADDYNWLPYPIGLLFTVTQIYERQGVVWYGARCNAFEGHPHGVERHARECEWVRVEDD